jgi:7-keto-8-aminopelargonate synthetase-like enzyme
MITLNGRPVINLSSNNYLGFANHPRLKKAAIEAIQKYGLGPEPYGPSSATWISTNGSTK